MTACVPAFRGLSSHSHIRFDVTLASANFTVCCRIAAERILLHGDGHRDSMRSSSCGTNACTVQVCPDNFGVASMFRTQRHATQGGPMNRIHSPRPDPSTEITLSAQKIRKAAKPGDTARHFAISSRRLQCVAQGATWRERPHM